MIYLDNSSTTHIKPKSVTKIFNSFNKKYNVNSSRGAYPLSINAGTKIFEARKVLGDFFNLKDYQNVIFTSGCTESINLALLGSVVPNGHIITTVNEHNSVLRTLTQLKEKYNVSISIIKPENNKFNLNTFKDAITPKTYLIVVNQTSNVTGLTIDIEKLGLLCKEKNIIFCVDAAQSAGHIKIDMLKQNINLLCIAGHKGLFGTQGIGALLINNIVLNPIKFGGTGTESIKTKQPQTPPESFEAGTQNLLGILTLNEGTKFVSKNFDKIQFKVTTLTNYLISELKKINEIKIYNSSTSSGVVSINIKTGSIDKLYNHLCKKNICTRDGLHCAPLIHKYLGTNQTGLIRISISYFNRKRDIKIIIREIKKYIKNQKPI